MARTILTTEAVEKSTYVVPVTFRDENGISVAPTAATWTLTNEYGVVINSRSDVAISPLAATVNIVPVSYTHLRAHETVLDLVCRLLLEKKKKQKNKTMHIMHQQHQYQLQQYSETMS